METNGYNCRILVLQTVAKVAIGLLCMDMAAIAQERTQPGSPQSAVVPAEDNPFILSPELEKIRAHNISTLQAYGYIEKLDEDPRAEYVQARMDERRAAALMQGLSENPQTLGFYDIAGHAVMNAPKLQFQPTLLDGKYLSTQSKGYLLLGGDRLKKLYTRTAFGTILIDEFTNASSTFESPNIKIAAQPATLIYMKL